MEQVFTLTQKAQDTIQRIMKDNAIDPDKGVRIGLIGGGCSGLQFVMDFELEKPGDYVLEFNAFKVIVDPMSLMYFDGLEVDYSDALVGGGFLFNSSKFESKCGCGSSVSYSP
jgi:iron-sulfur cluster assembly protein